uniref:Uncharacterized protein n=1 Tax=Megaselia scalaris TaxID=36166 RepID=T1GDF7_MEGSC
MMRIATPPPLYRSTTSLSILVPVANIRDSTTLDEPSAIVTNKEPTIVEVAE